MALLESCRSLLVTGWVKVQIYEVDSHFSREQTIFEKVILFLYVHFLAVGFPMLLSVEVQTGDILSLMPFHADTNDGNPRDLGAMVGCPHQCDGVYTLDISTFPQIRLSPLRRKATCQSFQYGFHLYHKDSNHWYEKRREVVVFLEEILQVFLIFYFSSIKRHYSRDFWR